MTQTSLPVAWTPAQRFPHYWGSGGPLGDADALARGVDAGSTVPPLLGVRGPARRDRTLSVARASLPMLRPVITAPPLRELLTSAHTVARGTSSAPASGFRSAGDPEEDGRWRRRMPAGMARTAFGVPAVSALGNGSVDNRGACREVTAMATYIVHCRLSDLGTLSGPGDYPIRGLTGHLQITQSDYDQISKCKGTSCLS